MVTDSIVTVNGYLYHCYCQGLLIPLILLMVFDTIATVNGFWSIVTVNGYWYYYYYC